MYYFILYIILYLQALGVDTEDDIHVLAAYLLGGKTGAQGTDSRKASIAVGPEAIEMPGAPGSERGEGQGQGEPEVRQNLHHTHNLLFDF